MKIWLLTTEYPPYFGGGIATYSGLTAEMLARHGHSVRVFIFDVTVPGDVLITSMKDGIEIYRFNDTVATLPPGLYGALRTSYLYAHWVSHFIDQDGAPDIIESHEYSGIAHQLLQRQLTGDPLLQDVPIVVTAHSPKFLLDPIEHIPSYRLPDYWTGEMERFVLRAASRVITPSQFLHDAIAADLPGFSGDVIANPMPAPMPHVPVKTADRLLYVGRIQYLKGVLTLLAAMDTLWSDGLTIGLDLMGGDALYHPKHQWMTEYLEHRYSHYIEDGRLTFIGPQTPQIVQSRMAESPILLVPSYFENFPYTVVEAMAHGCVVVASDGGGQRDIIVDGTSGILVSSQDASSLAEGILQAIHLTTEAKARMGEAARQRVDALCHPDIVYAQKMRVYTLAINEPRRHPTLFPFIRAVAALPPLNKNARDLSVVIPYYNLGAYIEETIASIKASDTVDIEIILVDDGSTDLQSIRQIYRLYQNHPDVTIIRVANGGLARARNIGATAAHGTHLAFLDGDDLVDPSYYARAIALLTKYQNVSFVGAWAQYFGEASGIWPTWNPEPPYMLYHNLVNSSALVYRRQDFIAHGQNDPRIAYGYEDYESALRLVSVGRAGIIIPEPLFHYRVRPNSMSRAFNPTNQQYLYEMIVKANPEFYAQHVTAVINLINSNGPQWTITDPCEYREIKVAP